MWYRMMVLSCCVHHNGQHIWHVARYRTQGTGVEYRGPERKEEGRKSLHCFQFASTDILQLIYMFPLEDRNLDQLRRSWLQFGVANIWRFFRVWIQRWPGYPSWYAGSWVFGAKCYVLWFDGFSWGDKNKCLFIPYWAPRIYQRDNSIQVHLEE